MSQRSNWEILNATFGSSRMAAYVLESNGNQDKAVELYVWNSRVSASLWELLGYVEVGLRNLISARIQILHEVAGGKNHWLLAQDENVLNLRANWIQGINEARRRVNENRKEVTGEQILSELTFGFWHQLVSKKAASIWPDIASGFKGLPARDQSQVADLVESLRQLRNRIGHHHRVWNLDLNMHLGQILTLAHFIDPELSAWINELEESSALIGSRPSKLSDAPSTN